MDSGMEEKANESLDYPTVTWGILQSLGGQAGPWANLLLHDAASSPDPWRPCEHGLLLQQRGDRRFTLSPIQRGRVVN